MKFNTLFYCSFFIWERDVCLQFSHVEVCESGNEKLNSFNEIVRFGKVFIIDQNIIQLVGWINSLISVNKKNYKNTGAERGTVPFFKPSAMAWMQALSSLHRPLMVSTMASFLAFSQSFSVLFGSFRHSVSVVTAIWEIAASWGFTSFGSTLFTFAIC